MKGDPSMPGREEEDVGAPLLLELLVTGAPPPAIRKGMREGGRPLPDGSDPVAPRPSPARPGGRPWEAAAAAMRAAPCMPMRLGRSDWPR